MLIELIVAILGVSLLIGFGAMALWKKDSPQWKAFPGLYTFLPGVLGIVAVGLLGGKWGLGNLSLTRLPWGLMALALLVAVAYYGLNLEAGAHLIGFKALRELQRAGD